MATEVAFHRRAPVPVKEMPERIWDEVEVQKSFRHTKDIDYWKQVRDGGSLYVVDEQLLEKLAPTHILTQALADSYSAPEHEAF